MLRTSPNTPPWIRTLTYAPIPPDEFDDTMISAYVTDDGSIDSVMVYYRVEGGSWGKVAATASDSLYTGTIPAGTAFNGDVVEYFMRAVDNLRRHDELPVRGHERPVLTETGAHRASTTSSS